MSFYLLSSCTVIESVWNRQKGFSSLAVFDNNGFDWSVGSPESFVSVPFLSQLRLLTTWYIFYSSLIDHLLTLLGDYTKKRSVKKTNRQTSSRSWRRECSTVVLVALWDLSRLLECWLCPLLNILKLIETVIKSLALQYTYVNTAIDLHNMYRETSKTWKRVPTPVV